MKPAPPCFEWAEVLQATSGQVISGTPITPVVGVSTDTRSLVPGNLFIALHGQRYDGHDFVKEAIAKDAAGVVVDERWLASRDRRTFAATVVGVPDTLRALADLAVFHRARCSMKVIGIAGSNGKTTTKDLLAHILSGVFRTVKSPQSFNNRIGVPLTILQCDAHTEVLIIELETNERGGIRDLCRIAQPWMGIVTNVGDTHLETLGTQKGVAAERQELIESLPADGIAVLNADDPLVLRMREVCASSTVRTYGIEAGEVRAVAIQPEGIASHVRLSDHRELRCPAPGRHNVYNLLGAVTAARVLGVDDERIGQALTLFRLPPMRWEVHQVGEVTLINDAYNANPQSMRAALTTFCEQPGARRIAVLGGMRELGTATVQAHHDLGIWLAKQPLHQLLTIGPLAREIADGARGSGATFPIETAADVDGAITWLQSSRRPGDMILLKGSRLEELERIATGLLHDRVPAC